MKMKTYSCIRAKKAVIVMSWIALSLLLAGCGVGGSITLENNGVSVGVSIQPDAKKVGLSGSSGSNIQSVDGQITENNPKVNSMTEIVRLNNCGGKADVEQIIERTQSFSFDAGGEAGVGYKNVVWAALSERYGESDEVKKSIILVAPPNTNMEYTLTWTERIYTGVIQLQSYPRTDYSVSSPIEVALTSSRDLGCP